MRLFNPLICYAILNMFGITSAVHFKDCGSSKARATSVAIYPCNFEPCTLIRGQQSSFQISFTAVQDIYPGGVRVKARLPSGVMTIPIPESNVCNHLTPRCPVMSGGHYSYRYTNVLPQQLPSGLWTIEIELLDTNTDPFVCVEINVHIA
ncbi:Phosphatidylglycerol/phosphatidylinositol transfer protein [Clonorchis sinensis]|uniref:Phosphatidylglycerol/phosphatidylinositol transfer protein n=1 Tax=Clonorchis sinensis TaxID=79923 RepID=A0A8T1N033_CLOSI|nr:Phosphatidylglycerol/phosphatidylinositol transfer protein [Clonorchis sinensis]